MEIIFVLVLAAIGGWVSRMCGGGWPKLSFGLDQWIYALPYGVILYACPYAAIPAYLTAMLGKRAGHGQYIHLGFKERQPYSYDEKLDFIIEFFFGPDEGGEETYWRCVAGLALTGLAVTIVPGILYAALVDPLAGAILAISGALKGLAYMAGWAARNFVAHPTAIGEIGTGIFGWGFAAGVYFL